jgi:hypothetical protein
MAEKDLLDEMDTAARDLLKSVNGSTVGEVREGEAPQPVDIKGRIAAFEAVTNYLAVKHKIQPAGVGKSGIDRYRDRINGGAPGSGAGRKGGKASGRAADTEADSDRA